MNQKLVNRIAQQIKAQFIHEKAESDGLPSIKKIEEIIRREIKTGEENAAKEWKKAEEEWEKAEERIW